MRCPKESASARFQQRTGNESGLVGIVEPTGEPQNPRQNGATWGDRRSGWKNERQGLLELQLRREAQSVRMILDVAFHSNAVYNQILPRINNQSFSTKLVHDGGYNLA